MLNTYQAYEIAKSEHAMDVQLSQRWVNGGVRIQRPNLLNRAITALRDMMFAAKRQINHGSMVMGGAAAK